MSTIRMRWLRHRYKRLRRVVLLDGVVDGTEMQLVGIQVIWELQTAMSSTIIFTMFTFTSSSVPTVKVFVLTP